MNTSELVDLALNYAVAKGLGARNLRHDTVATWWVTLNGKDRALSKGWAQSFLPSTDWEEVGQLIDLEKISISYRDVPGEPYWVAEIDHPLCQEYGPTALIAISRCFVTHRLGAVVDIPTELLK